MNTRGTNEHSVTEELPITLYEVVSRDGIVSPMKFTSAWSAAIQAEKWFPDQQQDPDRTGKGWDVQVVR